MAVMNSATGQMVRFALVLIMAGTGLLCGTPAAPQRQPAPFWGTLLVYDEQQRRMVLVNTYRPPAARPERGEMWEWDDQQWKLIPHSDSGPVMRYKPDVVYDSRRKRIVLYGGVLEQDNRGLLGDTWEWDGRRWQQMADTSGGLGLRNHHSMAYDSGRGKTVLYGGFAADSSVPPPKWESSVDVWEWDGSKWIKIVAPGPGPRLGFAFTYDRKRKQTILFGGGTGRGPGRFNDTWAWDGRAWRKLGEEGPQPRTTSAMVFDRRAGVILLYGGRGMTGQFEDMWQWDGKSWSEIKVTGPSPGKRNAHEMVYDAARGRVVLYGGVGENEQPVGEIWEWDGKQWKQVQ